MNSFLKGCSKAVVFVMTAALLLLFVGSIFGAERAKTEGECYASCFRIYNKVQSCAGSGTCFYQDEDGNCYIWTNKHVAHSNDCLIQNFADGNERGVTAKNIWQAYDESISLDVAILKVSAKDAETICPYYIPAWNNPRKILSSEDIKVMWCSSPKAYWLRTIEGRARVASGSRNIEVKPGFIGGMSGSSLLAKIDDEWFIIGINTWRTLPEGDDGWGGLTQPIDRIIKAMNGEVGEEIGDPIPVGAIQCPYEKDSIKPSGGKRVQLNDGSFAWECSTPIEEGYSVEEWSLSTCDPCQKAKMYWNPQIQSKGFPVSVRYGDGNDRFVADSLGITNYPTYRLLQGSTEIKRWVGYDRVNELDMFKTLDKIVSDLKKPKEVEPSNDCNDESCRLFGNRVQPYTAPKSGESKSSSGKFDLFNIPQTPDKPKEEPKVEPEQPRLLPKIFPKQEEEPKTEDAPDNDDNGGLFNWKGKLNDELQNQKDKLEKEFDNKVREVTMSLFWLMVLACLTALFSYKFVASIFRCLWWTIKKIYTTIKDKGISAIATFTENVASKISESASKVKNKVEK